MATADRDEANDERDERDAELARLRERVAFYESFDRVIAENVARSGDLLRLAMEMQSGATVQEETERQRVQELSRQRALLSALLDDVIQLQGQAERLARRVADALDEVESELPTGEFPAHQAPIAADSPISADTEQMPAPRLLTLLAHSLPDAAAARSLREYLTGLAQVAAVEPREFAEGVLRLDVTTRAPLAVADLGGWTTAGALEPVTERDDLIEIRMATHPAAASDDPERHESGEGQ